jgi:hypothetical protein
VIEEASNVRSGRTFCSDAMRAFPDHWTRKLCPQISVNPTDESVVPAPYSLH